MSGKKQSKKNFEEYEQLMKQKFDWEDRQVKIFNQMNNKRY